MAAVVLSGVQSGVGKTAIAEATEAALRYVLPWWLSCTRPDPAASCTSPESSS